MSIVPNGSDEKPASKKIRDVGISQEGRTNNWVGEAHAQKVNSNIPLQSNVAIPIGVARFFLEGA